MPMTRRGDHPDLDDDGNVLPDASLPPAQRDLERRFRDPGEQAHLMARVALWQARHPAETQAAVQGQTFAPGRGAYEGLGEYVQTVRANNQYVAQLNGKDVFVDDEMLERMSTAEYDQYFDQRGQPLPHVYYHPNRSARLNDAMDPFSARELRR